MGKPLYRVGGGLKTVPDPDPRRVVLPEEQCERMKRSEFNAVRALLIVVNYCNSSKQDLKERLQNGPIPRGWWRLSSAIGAVNAIMNDIVGTMTHNQARQIMNTIQDMDVKISPKAIPVGQTVVMDVQTAIDLTDCAREKCRMCAEDGESCRSCKLYQVMESTTPLEDYGNGLLCPYNLADWEE